VSRPLSIPLRVLEGEILVRQHTGLSGGVGISSEFASCSCGRGGGLNKSVRLVHLCPILHAEQHCLSLPLNPLLFSHSSASTMGSCGGIIPQSLCHSGWFRRVKNMFAYETSSHFPSLLKNRINCKRVL